MIKWEETERCESSRDTDCVESQLVSDIAVGSIVGSVPDWDSSPAAVVAAASAYKQKTVCPTKWERVSAAAVAVKVREE